MLSCSKEKDTLPARLYHRTTSYFNGYYNADDLFRETVGNLEDAYRYPEQGFIAIDYYGTEDEIKSYVPDFEKVIKKNDAVMFKHPNGGYIDDCRVLNGKAWYYRREYSLAMENFNYAMQTYPGSKRYPEAWLWKAKTFYSLENYQMARDVLRELVDNDTLVIDEALAGEIALFRVRLAIEDKEYKRAITLLTENLEFIRGQGRRARTQFLLGQLHAELKDYPRALEQFTEVAQRSNDYALAFEAKIKIARLYVDFQPGQDDEQYVYRYLKKMLRDEKNEEYRDRIYYEFALLELKKNQKPEAIGYLKQSLQASMGNQRQKALSYYKIGQIYFYDYQNYVQAQAYYDSAASVITPTSPEYAEIRALAKTLKEYITYKNIIAYEDSMLWLASLPQDRLDKLVDDLVAEEKRRREEEAERLLQSMNSTTDPFFNPQLQSMQNQGRGNNNSSGPWYFDNPTAVNNGRLQFQQTWGSRKNEDNWRRSRKAIELDLATESTTQQQAPVDSSLLKQYRDRYAYYKDIPRTDEQIAASNQRIEVALYKLGQVYSQKLNEPDSAIQTFERLLDRYAEGPYGLQARYALYRLYKEKKNPAFNVHKDYILTEHPETVYAYLIQGRDPNELQQDEQDFAFAYGGLFSAYASAQYETSVGFSNFLLTRAELTGTTEEIDLARLYYIRGMSYGYLGERDSLLKYLTYVVRTYPQHEVAPVAQRTLDFMQQGPTGNQPQIPGDKPAGDKPTADDARYKGFADKLQPSDKVFVLIFVPKDRISKNDATTRVSNFNQKFFAQAKLKVFTFMYKTEHLLPYISQFGTIDEAKQYIRAFEQDEASQGMIGGDARIFYISHTNFKVAYGQKRMEDYILYYDNVLNK
ncbi:MAG: hypothetical protein OHK0039_14180 [Bacteroidia bacterium]